jgi:hypothetical protein
LDAFKSAAESIQPDAGNGILSVQNATGGSTFFADVYDYKDSADEAAFISITADASKKLASGWAISNGEGSTSGSVGSGVGTSDPQTALIVLKGTGTSNGKSAFFNKSGSFLTVLTEVDADGNTTVRYRSGLMFTTGNATWGSAGDSAGWSTEVPSLSGQWGSVLNITNANADGASSRDTPPIGREYAAEVSIEGGGRVGAGYARAVNVNGEWKARIVLADNSGPITRAVGHGAYSVVITETDAERRVVVKHGSRNVSANGGVDWAGLEPSPIVTHTANTGIITIKNKNVTRTYSAEVYQSGGRNGPLTATAFSAYTAGGLRVAAGQRNSSVIYLNGSGGAFEGEGIYLVVITEYDEETWTAASRSLGAATFGANGNATLEWPAMMRTVGTVPMPRPTEGILTLTNTEGTDYTAKVYDFKHNWKFATYREFTSAKAAQNLLTKEDAGRTNPNKTDAPSAPADYEIYLHNVKNDKDGNSVSFNRTGPFLVVLTGGGKTKYKTGVLFNKGCAKINLTEALDAPKPDAPNARSVVPSSPEEGVLAVTPSDNDDYRPMADEVYYTKREDIDPNTYAGYEEHGTIETLPADGFTVEVLEDYGEDYYIWIRRAEDGIYSEWVLVAPNAQDKDKDQYGADKPVVNPVTIKAPKSVLSVGALSFSSPLPGTLRAAKADEDDTKEYEVFYALAEEGAAPLSPPNSEGGTAEEVVNGYKKKGVLNLAGDAITGNAEELRGVKEYDLWFRTTDEEWDTSWVQAAPKLIQGYTFTQAVAYMNAAKAKGTSEDDPLEIGLEPLSSGDDSGESASKMTSALTSTNAPANVVIDGNNRIVKLNSNGSLLTVGSGVTLTLKNIILRGKDANNASLVKIDGGHLILEDGAKITRNKYTETQNVGVAKAGGGVCCYSGGRFTMKGGVIGGSPEDGNSVGTGIGGGVFWANSPDGNPPPEDKKFIIYDGVISHNDANIGGGIYLLSTAGAFEMRGGRISNNKAFRTVNNEGGGGIYSKRSFTVGTESTSLPKPEITGNIADNGGGVFVEGSTADLSKGIVQGNKKLDGMTDSDWYVFSGGQIIPPAP